MNFSYGIIVIVGVLAAISIGFIAMDPNDIIEPRILESDTNKITQPEKVLKEIPVDPTVISKTVLVSIPTGVGVPGCESTNECYLPYEITVTTGTTVTWSNDGSAVHTVTSGLFETGGDGIFDSSILAASSVFEFTFNDAGIYDYYCVVHPWMSGIVNVN